MGSRSVFDARQLLGVPSLYRLVQRVVGSKRSIPRLTKLLAIKPRDRVLDIGCGPADILEYLPPDVEYHGFDINEEYISAARNRYGTSGNFTVQSVTIDGAERLGQFDVVIAVGVLHHLTDSEADALFKVAYKVLRPGGRVITLDGAFVGGQNPIALLLLKLDRGQHVRSPEQYLAIARQSFPCTRTLLLHDLLYVPYTHCLMEAVRPSQ